MTQNGSLDCRNSVEHPGLVTMAATATSSEGLERRWYANPAAAQWVCRQAPQEVTTFHAGLPDYARTPLVELPDLATELGVGRVFVKDESSRLGLPAFKALGAWWAIARILAARADLSEAMTLAALRAVAAEHPVILVTATDGNHGRAVARIAGLLGLRAHVFVPEAIPAAASAAIQAEGAQVSGVVGSYDQAVEAAARAAAARLDAELVQDTAWPGYEQVPGWIVEGYATLLREVDAQLVDVGLGGPDLLVVPVGVGSLAQAVVTHCRSRAPGSRCAVLGVEPEAAACVLASLHAGALRPVATAGTIMAGLDCGTPSALAWPHLRDGLDAAVAVPDAAAVRAVADLGRLGISSGASGAATLAGARAAVTGDGSALRRGALSVDPGSVVVLLSTEGRPTPPVAGATQ